jgi:hypothetical protein
MNPPASSGTFSSEDEVTHIEIDEIDIPEKNPVAVQCIDDDTARNLDDVIGHQVLK